MPRAFLLRRNSDQENIDVDVEKLHDDSYDSYEDDEEGTFFYKQPHFQVEPRVAIGSAQNEAQNCYEVANVLW